MRRARADLPAPHPGAAASSLRRPAPRPRPPPVSPARSPRPSPPRPPPHPRPGGSRGRGGWPEDTCPAPPLRRPPAPGQCDGGSGGRGGRSPRPARPAAAAALRSPRLAGVLSPAAPARALGRRCSGTLADRHSEPADTLRRPQPAPEAGPRASTPLPWAPCSVPPPGEHPAAWKRGWTPKQVFSGLL